MWCNPVRGLTSCVMVCVCVCLMRAWNEKRISCYYHTYDEESHMTHTWWHTYGDHRQIFVREMKLLLELTFCWLVFLWFCGTIKALLYLSECPDQTNTAITAQTNGVRLGREYLFVRRMCLKTVIILPVLSYWNHDFGMLVLVFKMQRLVFKQRNGHACVVVLSWMVEETDTEEKNFD